MSDRAHDKRVFIGGIGGGIGSALANRLSSEKWTVGGFGRPSEKWSAFREAHPDYDLHDAGAGDAGAVGAAVDAFAAAHGGLDAYVHAIGSVFLKPLHMLSDAEWAEVLAVNLGSAFIAARAVIQPMRKQKGGSLVFFSSVAAGAGIANHEAIAAAKGGIEGLTRSIAATYAPLGIRANAIAPGLVETPATTALTANEAARKVSERMHPLGRIGTPEEIASLAAWLVSGDSAWMTGQVLGMDGGMGALVARPRA
jgi:NAD(P)-dependent dehydrogenase (short-subunit alcohol dehydrogenase family)